MRFRKRWLALGIIGVVGLIGSSAWAFFNTTSAGQGYVTDLGNPPYEIVLSAPTGGPLMPGSGVETVAFTLTNVSNTTQTLHSEAYAISTDFAGGVYDTLTQAWVDTCKATWFQASGGDGGVAYPVTLAPGQSLVNGAVSVIMPANSTQDQSACQGLDPRVEIDAS